MGSLQPSGERIGYEPEPLEDLTDFAKEEFDCVCNSRRTTLGDLYVCLLCQEDGDTRTLHGSCWELIHDNNELDHDEFESLEDTLKISHKAARERASSLTKEDAEKGHNEFLKALSNAPLVEALGRKDGKYLMALRSGTLTVAKGAPQAVFAAIEKSGTTGALAASGVHGLSLASAGGACFLFILAEWGYACYQYMKDDVTPTSEKKLVLKKRFVNILGRNIVTFLGAWGGVKCGLYIGGLIAGPIGAGIGLFVGAIIGALVSTYFYNKTVKTISDIYDLRTTERIKEALHIFRLKPHCTERQVRVRFQIESLRTHPDKGGSAEEWMDIYACRQILLDYVKQRDENKFSLVASRVQRLFSYTDTEDEAAARRATETKNLIEGTKAEINATDEKEFPIEGTSTIQSNTRFRARSNHKLRKRSVCIICEEEKCNQRFEPCGHICCCYVCSEDITVCVICDTEIMKYVKVYDMFEVLKE